MKKVKPTDTITFGKHTGKTFNEISNIDPDYIIWLDENVKTIKLPEKFVDVVKTETSDLHSVILESLYQ
jgi:hypothetical protein